MDGFSDMAFGVPDIGCNPGKLAQLEAACSHDFHNCATFFGQAAAIEKGGRSLPPF